MDISKGINIKISKKDAKSVASLFILNNKTATKNLNNTAFDNLTKPFDTLLKAQHELNLKISFKNAENVFLAYFDSLINEEWPVEILEAILYNLFLVGLDKMQVLESHESVKEKSAKILQNTFKLFYDKKPDAIRQRIVPKLFNYLVYSYDNLCNYKMIDNLFSVFDTKIEFGSEKDRKIYKFMLGQHFLRKEDYKNAFSCFYYAFITQNERVKKEILPYLFFTGLYTKRYIKDEILIALGFESFCGIKEAYLLGNVDLFGDKTTNVTESCNKLYRFIAVELMYMTYRNLMLNLYNTLINNNKIYINDIVAYAKIWSVEKEKDCFVCIILNLIAKGYVKGYLNITKSVVVLSKENTFP